MSEHPGRCPSAYVRASERLCPSIRVSVRAPMSEHPGRCPSTYVRASERLCRASERICPSIRASVYERRYCLCPSAVLMDWLDLVLTRTSDSLGHGRKLLTELMDW
ncbi:unnamed protein product [Cochlearia groenlandica]